MFKEMLKNNDFSSEDFLENVNVYLDGLEENKFSALYKNLLAFCVIAIERVASNNDDLLVSQQAKDIVDAILGSGQYNIMTGVIVAMLRRSGGTIVVDKKEMGSNLNLFFKMSSDKIVVELEKEYCGLEC